MKNSALMTTVTGSATAGGTPYYAAFSSSGADGSSAGWSSLIRQTASPSAAADGAAGERSMPSSGHRLSTSTGHVLLWLLVLSVQ